MKEPLEKQLEKAYQIFKNDHERLREKLMDSVLESQKEQQIEIESEPELPIVPKRRSSGPSFGEIIMSSRTFKIAAGIIIVGIVSIALKVFTGSNSISSVAFGEVLNQIQSKSYTFDVSFISEGQIQGTNKCMMLQPGILRTETPEIWGGITSISNFNTDERIMIIHGQKTVINLKDIPEIVENAQEIGPFAMLQNPIENLWNLQDSTETILEEKEIDGQSAIGFKVAQNSGEYQGDIIVWANRKTGVPIQVDITLQNPDNLSESMTVKLSNFKLDVELDPELFSMEIPEGYTLAYQNTLEETIQQGQSSPEAEKIMQSIELWSNGNQDKAIETLLSVDWTGSFNFPGDMYFFSLTDKENIQLKQEDQYKVMQEIVNTQEQIRRLCSKVWKDAQTAVSNKEFEKAEQYLTTTLKLGQMINRDSEITTNVRMTGFAFQLKSLDEMLNLYKESGEQEKLQQTQEHYDKVNAERESEIQSSI